MFTNKIQSTPLFFLFLGSVLLLPPKVFADEAKAPAAPTAVAPAAPAPAPGQDPEMTALMAELEKDFQDPKKPDIDKARAVEGKRNAPIQLVEYSDFQCPYCQKGFTTVEEIRQKYGKKILFVFKNLPLPFHPLALPAAKRFLAISLQSAKKAYEFHDEIFKNQQAFTAAGESYLDDVAKKLKVNMAKMKKDIDGDMVSKLLEADRAEAQKFEFSGTPGFVVAGVRIKGAYPTPVFVQIIDRQLAAAKPVKKSKSKVKEVKKEEEAPSR